MWRSCGDLERSPAGRTEYSHWVPHIPLNLSHDLASRLFIRAWPVAHLGACACSDQSGLCGTAAWHGARTEPENATSEVIA